MAQHRVLIEQSFPAAPEQVFALFADHDRFARLLGIPGKRVQPGDDPASPNGVGSTRQLIGIPGLAFDETVTRFEPNALIEYTISRGGPIKNHAGRIRFDATESGGTQLTYTIEFDEKIPLTGKPIAGILNTGLRRAMGKVMQQV